MAKFSTTPIGATDLVEYLDGTSDFSFELKVLEMLVGKGLACHHGGTYKDPVTDKVRQFDIRAFKSHDYHHVSLAVECKNIRESFPVLGSCVPRLADEAYHEVFMRYAEGSQSSSHISLTPPAMRENGKTLRVRAPYSMYAENGPVGKATAQVGRAPNNGEIVSNDSELFEKWSQSLASASALAGELDSDDDADEPVYRTLVPMVVVPDGRLWIVEYDKDGHRRADPTQTCRISCFVGHTYDVDRLKGEWFRVSHIELMTLSGLDSFATSLDDTETLFPKEGIMAAIKAWIDG